MQIDLQGATVRGGRALGLLDSILKRPCDIGLHVEMVGGAIELGPGEQVQAVNSHCAMAHMRITAPGDCNVCVVSSSGLGMLELQDCEICLLQPSSQTSSSASSGRTSSSMPSPSLALGLFEDGGGATVSASGTVLHGWGCMLHVDAGCSARLERCKVAAHSSSLGRDSLVTVSDGAQTTSVHPELCGRASNLCPRSIMLACAQQSEKIACSQAACLCCSPNCSHPKMHAATNLLHL